MPDGGFTVELDELLRAGKDTLPKLAQLLRTQLDVLGAHEGLHGPGGGLAEVAAFQASYAGYTDAVAARQKHGCGVMDATATAAREIAELYRRADGQR